MCGGMPSASRRARPPRRRRDACLDEVAARGLDRKPRRLGVDLIDVRRAGQQQVLDGRRLEHAVVRRAQHQICRRRPGEAQSRAERVLVHDEVVTIPSEPGAEGQRSAADRVLDEERLLVARLFVVEPERLARAFLDEAVVR